jgi:hypothetical protein
VSAAAVEGVDDGGLFWHKVLKGGNASQFCASKCAVADGKEMESASVGFETRRFGVGEAGVRKEWVRWSRMCPSR